MSCSNYTLEQMKENMDSNIVHQIRDPKSINQKRIKSTKQQPFRDIDEIQSRPIKKNAYIMDSDQETSPQKTTAKKGKSHGSIDSVSQIMGNLSKEASIPTSPKTQVLTPVITCNRHSQQVYSYNFCIQCSEYLMCVSCIKYDHSTHMILTFGNEQQTKTMTKQFLIEKIQETLHKLKSKENDIKNKSSEMELILQNVKRMEEQVMNKLQTIFRDVADLVRKVYQKQSALYEKNIEQFYKNYNGLGDDLRENLLTIIDQSFQLKSFEPSLVSKEPPLIPDQHICRFKSVLQKTKLFYKSVIQSLDQLKEKTIYNTQIVTPLNKHLNPKTLLIKTQASTKKYQKFLSDTCYHNDNRQNNKSSLIKILDTLSK